MAKQVEAPELKNIDEAINLVMQNVGYVQKKRAELIKRAEAKNG